MRIVNVNLESYGEKKNLFVNFDDKRIALVHGANEAGKSTLLSFIRNALFPSNKDDSVPPPFSTHDKVATGSLEFRLADEAATSGRIFRSWKNKKCDVSELQIGGQVFDPNKLPYFIECHDRDFYANYFGFTYAEIVHGADLLGRRDLSRLLYGMAAGSTDLLEKTCDDIDKRLAKLFAPQAKKLTINKLIAELEKLSKTLSESKNLTAVYKHKVDECDLKKRERESVAQDLDEAQRRAKYWDNALKALEEYRRYRDALAQYEARCSTSPRFAELIVKYPPEKEDDYEKAMQTAESLQANIIEIIQSIETGETELNDLDIKSADKIIVNAKAINDLSGAEKLFKEKEESLPKRKSGLESKRNALDRELAELGALELGGAEPDRVEARQKYSILLLDAILEECRDYREEEKDAREAFSNSRSNYESHLSELNAMRDEYERNNEAFNQEYKLTGLAELTSSVNESEHTVKDAQGEIKSLRQELAELDRDLAHEEHTACELFCQTRDGNSDFSTDEAIDALSKLTEPNEYESIAEEAKDLVKERASLIKTIEECDSDIEKAQRTSEFDLLEFERARSELETSRSARDAAWNEIKREWLDGGDKTLSEMTDLAEQFGRRKLAADHVADRLFDLNRAFGVAEAHNSTLNDLQRKRESKERELRELDEKLADLNAQAAELWRKYGFESCARWSRDASLAWLLKWKEWNARHFDAAKRIDAFDVKLSHCERLLVGAMKTFARWVAPEVDVDSFDAAFYAEPSRSERVVLLQDFALATRVVCKRALERVKACEELGKKLSHMADGFEKKEKIVADLALECEKYQQKLDELAEKRVSFCSEKKLALFESYARDWNSLYDAINRLDAWQENEQTYLTERLSYEDDSHFVAAFIDQAVDLATTVFGESWGALADVGRLREALKDANNIKTSYREREKELDNKRSDLRNKTKKRDDAYAQMAEIRAETSVSDEDFDAFREFAAEYRRLDANLKETRDRFEMKSNVKLGTDEATKFCADLESKTESELRQLLEESRRCVSELDAQKEALMREIVGLEKDIQALEQKSGRREALARQQAAVCELRGYINEFAPLKIAHEIITRSLKRFKKDKIPALFDRAEKYLKRISDGRYTQIKESDSNEDEFVVQELHGVVKTPAELSLGTREQLFLALRLALIEQYDEHSEPLPVLMDDVFVNSDETRTRRILECLNEMASDKRQIILLTCRNSTRDAFIDVVGEENVIELEPAKL